MRMILDGLILILVLGGLNYVNALLHRKENQKMQKHFLNKEEVKIAKENNFPLEILKKLKYQTSGNVENIYTSSFASLEPDKKLPGVQLCFSKNAHTVSGNQDIGPELHKIAEQYRKYPELKEYVITVFELFSLLSQEKELALIFLKTENPLDLLKVTCPNPDGSLESMKEYTDVYTRWYAKKPYKILFIAPDVLQFQFLTPLPKDEAVLLAKAIYKYSPDTVDMAYDTKEDSALALQQYALALEYSGFVEFYWG